MDPKEEGVAAGRHDDDGDHQQQQEQRLPRHQLMRPSRLSMDLVDTPSADPPPVVGTMSDAPSAAAACRSPVGTIRVVSEKLQAPKQQGKGAKGGRGKHEAAATTTASPRRKTTPTSRSSAGASSGGGGSGTGAVRVSSPLCVEVGVAKVHSPKAAATTTPRTPGGGRSSKLGATAAAAAAPEDNDAAAAAAAAAAVQEGSSMSESDLEELSLDHSGQSSVATAGSEASRQRQQQQQLQRQQRRGRGRREGGDADAEEEESMEEDDEEEATAAAAGRVKGASVFRPLSPLVLPVLRSPTMRMVLSAERLDKVIQAFEDDASGGSKASSASSSSSANNTTASGSRSASPAVEAIKAVSTLAKKVVQASVDAVTPAAAAAAPPPAVVVPTPIRGASFDSNQQQPLAPALPMMMPPSHDATTAAAQQQQQQQYPPLSPFTQVKPHAVVPGSLQEARRASFAAAAASCGAEGERGSPTAGGSVVEALVGLVGNFPFAVGACLLACGLSQAGIEWYTTTLGSDFSTWWAGAICAALGLLTMVSRHGPTLSLANTTGAGSSASGSSRVCGALYALLAMGGAAAIIVALFFDLRLLDRLNKADVCAASTDNLVLDNGIVLTQTMGAACGLSTGCACVEYTNPFPAGDVTCMNFPRAGPGSCASIPYAVSGLVRVSIWFIAGLLFFMSVLILRAGAARPAAAAGGGSRASAGSFYGLSSSSKVLALGSDRERARRRQQRRRAWRSGGAAAVEADVSGRDADDEAESSDDDEDVEEAIQGIDVAAAAASSSSSSSSAEALAKVIQRSMQLLTPIPEYAPAAATAAVRAKEEEEEGEEEEEDDDDEYGGEQQIPVRQEPVQI